MERKLNPSKAYDMLMNDVLAPLLNIIYLYKESQGYNDIPDGDKEDADAGWDYFSKRFYEIYAGLNKNLYLDPDTYQKIYRIIEEIQAFVRAFSYADGLAERYFEANPNLRFFRVAFGLRDASVEAYEMCVRGNRFAYVPKEEDFWVCKQYFYEQEQLSKSRNFRYDEEDLFMKELGIAVRTVFLKALCD